MRLCAAAAIIVASGSLASAQSVVRVSCTWTEMVAGTNTPVLNPDGVLGPGEGALIQFSMYAERNGASAIGQEVLSNGHVGTLRGLGSLVYDLVGSGADATGSWNSRAMSPIFTWFPNTGSISQGGALLTAINAAQIAHGGAIVDGTNPITVAWRGVWNPGSYDLRTVHFQLRASTAVPVGQQNAVDVEVGNDPATGVLMYVAAYFDTDFGPGVDIPIDPGTSFSHSMCYPNCDGSTGSSTLNVNDFVCFLNLFATGSTLANCDGSVREPVLNSNDFVCYMNKFAMSCP